jgi:hypothetical protein
MGFLQDIRNLQLQADAMTPPARRGVTAQHLMADGRPGSATIIAVRDTGLAIDHDPTIELDLAVVLDGGAAYDVTHRQTISRIAIPSFKPGATIPVRVDPADRQSLMIG